MNGCKAGKTQIFKAPPVKFFQKKCCGPVETWHEHLSLTRIAVPARSGPERVNPAIFLARNAPVVLRAGTFRAPLRSAGQTHLNLQCFVASLINTVALARWTSLA